jgi:chromosome segregation ATPase
VTDVVAPAESRQALAQRLREVNALLDALKREHHELKGEVARLDARLSDPATLKPEKPALRARKDEIRFRPRELADRLRALREEKHALKAELGRASAPAPRAR